MRETTDAFRRPHESALPLALELCLWRAIDLVVELIDLIQSDALFPRRGRWELLLREVQRLARSLTEVVLGDALADQLSELLVL